MKVLVRTIMFFAFLMLNEQVLAQDGTEGVESFQLAQKQVKLIISDQIAAFRDLDVDRAYGHASESIKSIFPTSKIFGAMVKKSYPMIWNPKTYEFLKTTWASIGILQRVMFTDHNGKMHFFDYTLESNDDRWVISGVYMVEGETGV